MSVAVEADNIDAFIRQQKQRLARERHDLDLEEPQVRETSPRKKWDRQEPDARIQQLAVQIDSSRVKSPEGKALPGTRNSVDAKRKKLQEERRREYNELLQKKPVPGNHRLATPQGRSLPVGQGQDVIVDKRKALQEERAKEYNKMLAQMPVTRQRPPTPEESGLPIGQYSEQKKKLEAERVREYNELLEKPSTMLSARQEYRDDDMSPAQFEYLKRKILEERERSYQRDLARIERETEPHYNTAKPQNLQTRAVHFTDSDYRETSDYGYHPSFSRSPRRDLENDRPSRSYVKQATYDVESHQQGPDKNEKLAPEKGYQSSRKENLPPKPATPNGFINRLGGYEQKKKKLDAERKQEYNQILEEKAKRGIAPPARGRQTMALPGMEDDTTKEDVVDIVEARRKANLELFEECLRQKYRKERKRKSGKAHPRALRDSFMATKPYSAHSQDKAKQRNEEYNAFIREKEKSRKSRNVSSEDRHNGRQEEQPTRPPQESYLGTLPGLGYNNSAKARDRKEERNQEYREMVKVMELGDTESEEPDVKPYSRKKANAERNKDYNEFLKAPPRRGRGRPPLGAALSPREPPKGEKHTSDPEADDSRWRRDQPPGAPRKGWGTPTYEEILEKKRQEENRYRRYDDQEYQRPGMRSYASEGALHRMDPQRRPDDYDRDYERRPPPRDRGPYNDRSILNDDDWLRPQADLYDALNRMKDSLAHVANDAPFDTRSEPERLREDRHREPPPHQQGPPQPGPAQPPPVNATLLIGVEERNSAKRRKRDAYRDELQKQMSEDVEKRRWEKKQDVRVNATGMLDPEKRPDRLRGLPPASEPTRRPEPEYRSASTKPISTLLDQLSPRTEAILGRRSAAPELQMPGGRAAGILEQGWGELYERPRPSFRPPPDVGYQPSSYLTGGAGPYSDVDQAYQFYGMRNPLELESYNDVPRVSHDPNPSSARVTFEEPSYSPQKPEQRRSGLPFPVEEDNEKKSKSKHEVQSYQVELRKQIEEQRLKKQLDKEEQERLERKWEEENRNYNPYGRGGGGAPMRDTSGNAVADLRHMRQTNSDPHAPKESPRVPQPVSPRYVANSPPPSMAGTAAQGEGTHARGGHGIFGVPKTEEEKSVSDKYKDELRLQIEEKKRRAAEEKAKIRAEEDRENRKIQEQQDKIQREYDEELRKKREKEEESNRRNEEIKQLAKEKKREAEQQRKESEERRLQELRERQEEERLERERERMKNQRSSSPPVPAVKSKLSSDPDVVDALTSDPVLISDPALTFDSHKIQHAKSNEDRGKSPVVPALRKNSASTPQPEPRREEQEKPQQRASSADVLDQLAAMRRQLQNERLRVENALEHQKNDYEVYDPRLVQRPPVAPRREPEVDIFEASRNRAPVSVRRAPTDNADPSNVQEFNYLKHKADTDSRRDFRTSFPEQPVSNDDLETQQLALIRKQEEYKRDRPAKSIYEQALPHMQPRDLGLVRKDSISPQAMLQSDSAFIEVNDLDQFPEDFDDLPRRNDSARQRRRVKTPVSPRYNPDNISLGSNVSLDAERISKKNEERLKRLKQMSDETSLADPDDVLDRFMAKQRHNRPPSGQTLHDDTWMRPGSK